MKSFESALKKYTEKTRLKSRERQDMRERILAFMEYHPLSKQSDFLARAELVSEPFWIVRLPKNVIRYGVGAMVFFIVLVPFVAERAVPGDILYAVKTGINEPIQSQFANTSYEKIEFETRLMERRIAEARVLARKGELTDEVKSQIAETMKVHSASVQKEISLLREDDVEGAAIAQIAYTSSLEAQSVVLGAVGSETEETSATSTDVQTDPLLIAVNEAQDAVNREQGSTTPSFDPLMARIELQTTRVQELFETIKTTASENEVADIERRISDVNRMIEEAKTKKASDELAATQDLILILKQVQKLILFMTDIDVRTSVALNDLVPVVLSKEEQVSALRAEMRDVAELLREVTNTVSLVPEKGIVDKIQRTLAHTDVLMLKASTAIDITDTESADASLKEARTLAEDMRTLIAQHSEVIKDENPPAHSEDTTATTSATSTDAQTGSNE